MVGLDSTWGESERDISLRREDSPKNVMPTKASDAIEFFFPRSKIPSDAYEKTTSGFISEALKSEGTWISSAYEFAYACYFASYLPEYVLDALRQMRYGTDSRGARQRAWNAKKLRFLRELILATNDFDMEVTIRRFIVPARLPPAEQKEIYPRIDEASEFLLTRPVYEELKLRVFPHVVKFTMKKFVRSFVDERVDEYFTIDGEIERAIENRDAIYRHLSLKDVLLVRGREGFVTACASAAGLSYLLFTATGGDPFGFIRTAFAQTTAASKPDFVPPLGIPLSTWVPMVIGFYVFLLAVLGVFLWKGYFSEAKSERAATFIDRFGTLALGVFLGKLGGL